MCARPRGAPGGPGAAGSRSTAPQTALGENSTSDTPGGRGLGQPGQGEQLLAQGPFLAWDSGLLSSNPGELSTDRLLCPSYGFSFLLCEMGSPPCLPRWEISKPQREDYARARTSKACWATMTSIPPRCPFLASAQRVCQQCWGTALGSW